MTLTDFLLARIAEDEAWPERVRRGHDFGWQPSSYATRDPNILCVNPARVLAECEAKRRIVDLSKFSDSDRSAVDFWLEPEQRDLTPPGFTAAMIGVLQALASVYADHPDYREEWLV